MGDRRREIQPVRRRGLKREADGNMPDLSSSSDLHAILTWIRSEHLKKKAGKRIKSHGFARRFSEGLAGEEVRLLGVGPENSNYFMAQIAGITWAISAFASLEGWWDTPSDGFRHMVKKSGCGWGTVFFDLSSDRKSGWKGFWIEGKVFDERVLRTRVNMNLTTISRAEKSGLAHPFCELNELVSLIKRESEKKPKVFLRRAKRDTVS